MQAQFFKREFALFFSYASADAALAEPTVRWLQECAGLKVWYDRKEIEAGTRAASALEAAVRRARAYVLLLTPASLRSRWVAEEHDVAHQEAVDSAAFKRIVLVTPDVDPADIPSALKGLTQIRLPAGGLDGASGAKLLKSLRFDKGSSATGTDVFITRSWRQTEVDATRFADEACARLAGDGGLQLIGDEPRPDEDAERQRNIIASCAAYLAIVPPREPDDLIFLLRELPLARAAGVPTVVVADPKVIELEQRGLLKTADGTMVRFEGARVLNAPMGAAGAPRALCADLSELLNETARLPTAGRRAGYSVVYAGAPERLNADERKDIDSVVRGITGRGCVFPEDLDGEAADERLLREIEAAVATIADVSPGQPDGWVLAGAARAARRPVTLVSGDGGAPDATPRLLTQFRPRVYRNHTERVGMVHAALYGHRRLLINQQVLKWS